MKKEILVLAVLAGIFSICSGFILSQDKKPWPVPDKDAKVKNPVATDATSLAEGKNLYNLHCKSCHGAKGLGDGSKAAQLKTEPGDFTSANFQSQTDGEIFYKTSEGRDDMPNFKKKLPDADERWSVVNYVRSLKK